MSGFLVRRVAGRLPTLVLLALLALEGFVRLLVFVVTRWWLAYPLLVALAVWHLGPATVGAVVGGLALLVVLGCAYWSTYAPESWQRRVGGPVRSWWRGRAYRRAWDDAMGGCKLVRGDIVPTLMSCRTHGGVDRLLVHMAPGQLPADWRDVAPRLASALGVRSVRVRSAGPRDVLLLVRWREIRAHDPEVLDDAAVDAEVAETTEQLVAEVPARAFPRRPR